MKAKTDYRHRARLHVKAARVALATPSEDAAHYACLKTRMAIEALTYQVLQACLDAIRPPVRRRRPPFVG